MASLVLPRSANILARLLRALMNFGSNLTAVVNSLKASSVRPLRSSTTPRTLCVVAERGDAATAARAAFSAAAREFACKAATAMFSDSRAALLKVGSVVGALPPSTAPLERWARIGVRVIRSTKQQRAAWPVWDHANMGRIRRFLLIVSTLWLC